MTPYEILCRKLLEHFDLINTSISVVTYTFEDHLIVAFLAKGNYKSI